MTDSGMALGALGGPHTFNGQAAEAMAKAYPFFTRIVHYPTSDEAVAAALRGEVDATCAPEQMSATGFHAGMLARMTAADPKLYVVAETSRAYQCCLLGKAGAALSQVRHVLGHNGSIAHSRAWLERRVPHATIEVVTTHSEVAAQAVLDSDGSLASVGSPGLATKFGLALMANDIDGGGMVNYWAISLKPRFAETPKRLSVAGRFNGDTQMSALIGALMAAGFALTTVYSRPSGHALDDYDSLLRFKGSGRLADVEAAVAPFPLARLAGAWVTSSNP